MRIMMMITVLMFMTTIGWAEPVKIDIRHRPPEMSIVDNKYYGPLIDIITIMVNDIEQEPQWLNVPWPRTLLRAQNGKVDIIPRHSMTSEREQYLLPMLLGYEQRHVRYLFGPHIKKADQYKTLQQLRELNFGLLRGSYYGPFVETIDTRDNTIFTNNIEQLMALLLSERIDVMPIQNIKWAEQAFLQVTHKFKGKKYQLSEIEETFMSGKYISMPKNSKLVHFFHQLNCRLYTLRNAGEIDNIYQKYAIAPYLQVFDNAESQLQQSSCRQIAKDATNNN